MLEKINNPLDKNFISILNDFTNILIEFKDDNFSEYINNLKLILENDFNDDFIDNLINDNYFINLLAEFLDYDISTKDLKLEFIKLKNKNVFLSDIKENSQKVWYTLENNSKNLKEKLTFMELNGDYYKWKKTIYPYEWKYKWLESYIYINPNNSEKIVYLIPGYLSENDKELGKKWKNLYLYINQIYLTEKK